MLSKMCLNEMYIKSVYIIICLKQGDTLKLLLFNFTLHYATKTGQENQVGLKLNGTHQLLAYAADVNLLGRNVNALKKNTGHLTDTTYYVGAEVKLRKLSICCCPVTRV
jgi:hypothetical protein